MGYRSGAGTLGVPLGGTRRVGAGQIHKLVSDEAFGLGEKFGDSVAGYAFLKPCPQSSALCSVWLGHGAFSFAGNNLNNRFPTFSEALGCLESWGELWAED